MSTGIVDILGSAVTFVLAAPLALAGLELLLGGNHLVGGGLLTVAAAMVLVEHYITTPGDLPGLVARKLVGFVARPPDEE